MTDKEKAIKELKEALDSLDITNKYRLNLIRAIEYLQEEPVSEKKCMFTKDSFTDEDRKVLCEDYEYAKKVEPAEIDFEKELYKAFGQVKDFTLGMRIAKWFYDMGKNSQEPVSIWHDASEDALKDKLLIVEFGGEHQHGYAVKRAGHFEETEWNYTRWCYLSDIKKLQ